MAALQSKLRHRSQAPTSTDFAAEQPTALTDWGKGSSKSAGWGCNSSKDVADVNMHPFWLTFQHRALEASFHVWYKQQVSKVQ